jgi:hypothetical protein
MLGCNRVGYAVMAIHGTLTQRGRRDCARYNVDPQDIDDVLNDAGTQVLAGRDSYDYHGGVLPDGRKVELTCTRRPPILVHRVIILP